MVFRIVASLAVAMLMVKTANAVMVCDNWIVGTNGCTGNCHLVNIGFGDGNNNKQNIPSTACFYNSASDTGFDMLLCSGYNASGNCINLSDLQRTTITGDFNWVSPNLNIQSIIRSGA